jgi:hypothetical protein
MHYVGEGKYIPERDYRADLHVGHTWKTLREIPSGWLRLTAYSPFHDVQWSQQWDERKKVEFEKDIGAVLLSLESAALNLTLRLESKGRYFGD